MKRERAAAAATTPTTTRNVNVKGRDLFSWMYLQFTQTIKTKTSLMNTSFYNPMIVFYDVDALYGRLRNIFVHEYSQRDLKTPDYVPGQMTALKRVMDTIDLYYLVAFLFVTDLMDYATLHSTTAIEIKRRMNAKIDTLATQFDTTYGNNNNNNNNNKKKQASGKKDWQQELHARLRKLVVAGGDDDKEAIRILTVYFTVYQTFSAGAASVFHEDPTSMPRLYARLRELSGVTSGSHTDTTLFDDLCKQLRIVVQNDDVKKAEIRRYARQSHSLRFYESLKRPSKPRGKLLAGTEPRQKVFTLAQAYAKLHQVYPLFGQLVRRYILSTGDDETTVTLDDMNSLLYAATAPLYRARASERSPLFQMTYDVCFLLREQHRQQVNIVHYVRHALSEPVLRNPAVATENDMIMDEAPPHHQRTIYAVDPSQIMANLLVHYERYKTQTLANHYTSRLPPKTVLAACGAIGSRLSAAREQSRAAFYRVEATLDPLEDEALHTTVKTHVLLLQRLLAEQTYLYYLVTDVLYPRFVDAVWRLLLGALRRALRMPNGTCCSPRDATLLRRLLLDDASTWFYGVDAASGLVKLRRFRLPLLTKRVFDTAFVAVVDMPDFLSQPEAGGGGGGGGGQDDEMNIQTTTTTTTLKDAFYRVRAVLRDQLLLLQCQLAFFHEAFFRDVTVARGFTQSRSTNPVYHCFRELMLDLPHTMGGMYGALGGVTLVDLYQAMGTFIVLEFQSVLKPDETLHTAAYVYMKVCRAHSLNTNTENSLSLCTDMRLLDAVENNATLFSLRHATRFVPMTPLLRLRIVCIEKTRCHYYIDRVKRLLVTRGLTHRLTEQTLVAILYDAVSLTNVAEASDMRYLPNSETADVVVGTEMATLGALKTALETDLVHRLFLPFVPKTKRRAGETRSVAVVANDDDDDEPSETTVPVNLMLLYRNTENQTYEILNNNTARDQQTLDSDDARDNLFLVAVPYVTSQSRTLSSAPPTNDDMRILTTTTTTTGDTLVLIEWRRYDSPRGSLGGTKFFRINAPPPRDGAEREYAESVVMACFNGDDQALIDYRVAECIRVSLRDEARTTTTFVMLTLVWREDRALNVSSPFACEFSAGQYTGLCNAVADYITFQYQREMTRAKEANTKTVRLEENETVRAAQQTLAETPEQTQQREVLAAFAKRWGAWKRANGLLFKRDVTLDMRLQLYSQVALDYFKSAGVVYTTAQEEKKRLFGALAQLDETERVDVPLKLATAFCAATIDTVATYIYQGVTQAMITDMIEYLPSLRTEPGYADVPQDVIHLRPLEVEEFLALRHQTAEYRDFYTATRAYPKRGTMTEERFLDILRATYDEFARDRFSAYLAWRQRNRNAPVTVFVFNELSERVAEERARKRAASEVAEKEAEIVVDETPVTPGDVEDVEAEKTQISASTSPFMYVPDYGAPNDLYISPSGVSIYHGWGNDQMRQFCGDPGQGYNALTVEDEMWWCRGSNGPF